MLWRKIHLKLFSVLSLFHRRNSFLAFFPPSLPFFLFFFFVATCAQDCTGHWLSSSVLSEIKVSWPVSPYPAVIASVRVQSGRIMKGMVWIQLSPVAGNQADQLNSGNFLLSLVEKLSFVITVWVSQLQQESPWAPIR